MKERGGVIIVIAFETYAKKMTREKRVPFDVSEDPFYSESNMTYLKIFCDKRA